VECLKLSNKRVTTLLLLLVMGVSSFAMGACTFGGSKARWAPTTAATLKPPTVAKEMRGVWVATVANIDWPTTPGAPKEQQLAEIDQLIDLFDQAGLNAIYLQIRPTADALYRSKIEPWSAFVSGEQGKDPGYDPLEEWIKRAHAKGMELHAWFNPYRAHHPRSIGQVHPTHITKTQPELMRPYAGYIWSDPGEARARLHFLRVVEDVMVRYQIDGVHIDDYFYPYPVAGRPFPDEPTYARYKAAGGKLSLADWRRSNTDTLVRELYEMVKLLDRSVTVSISPFGIWRPGNPPGIKGMDAYENIYADSRKWLREGWLDAMVPQLYWAIDPPDQSFPALLNWWDGQNILSRHLWPGLRLTQQSPERPDWLSREIAQQISLVQNNSNAQGVVMFSGRMFREYPEFTKMLAQRQFSQPAVVPDSPWLSSRTPVIRGSMQSDRTGSVLELNPIDQPLRWVVHQRSADGWRTRVLPGRTRTVSMTSADDAVVVQGVYRGGVRSTRLAFQRQQ